MRRLAIFGMVSALWLAACGSNTLSGTSTPPVTGPAAAGMTMVTSSAQIASGAIDATGSATITAFVHDANNNTISGVTVAFTPDSGLLAVTQAVTDANGMAKATLTSTDPTNRTITVNAAAGTATASVTVDVVGTTLALTGPQSLVEPGSASYRVVLLNATGGPISGKSVTLSSSNGNMLSATSLMTDANGQGTFTLTAANGGTDTLKATALGISATEAVDVSTQSFAITAPADKANINIGVSTPVSVLWTNSGAAVAGQVVNFSATRGTLSAASATTDGTGKATVNLSSTTSGPSVITASSTGVSTQVNVDFIATAPAAIAVQATPSTIPVNGQSVISAVVRDANNNLVEGKLVTFSLTDVTGGTLSVASSATNSQGVAQTIYTASSTTSATNGVVVTATVQGTSVADSATLTVAGKTLFLSLGTGNKIISLNDAQYAITYAVQAIDGAGNPVHAVPVALKINSLTYVKGYRGAFDTVKTFWPTVINAVCASEDLNNNGILDPGEDFNNDGKLEPGSVAAASPGSVTTSSAVSSDGTVPEGAALFQVVFPKDHAYYVTVGLTATATVGGTESSVTTSFLLPGATTDFGSATTAPPGPESPYGQATSCANPN